MKTKSHRPPILIFADALDRYGTDMQRWPGDLRAMAEEMLESSPDAGALLAEAVELDAALGAAFAAPSLPVGLEARINARAERRDVWLEWLTAFVMRPWRPVGAACVPLVLGFALGLGAAEDTADLEDSMLAAFLEHAPEVFELGEER